MIDVAMDTRPRISFMVPLLLLLAVCGTLHAQRSEGLPVSAAYNDGIPGICEKCAAPEPSYAKWLVLQVPHWGYGYSDMLADLVRWSRYGTVAIDSIGASVEGRALWQVTITGAGPTEGRHRVFVHARTHPGEVQGMRVANAMISFLVSDDPFAALLREHILFHVIPMYNPDGVELDLPRENAHGIDLERNWDREESAMEPEPAALHRRFTELMASPNPIELALNLHSAGLCERYFVYHDTVGTSAAYTAIEQRFISDVQSFFPTGIQPWSFYRSWTDSTPPLFPESWWWRSYGARVLALTYEDMNCSDAGMYDTTASAILHGIGRFFGIELPAEVAGERLRRSRLAMAIMPNPASSVATIRYQIPVDGTVSITIHDLLGDLIATPVDDFEAAGEHETRWSVRQAPPGVYICTLRTGQTILTRRITIAP